jgi:hypothetical protein
MALTSGGGGGLSFGGGASPDDPVDSVARGLLYGATSLNKGKLVKSRMAFQEDGIIMVLKGITVDNIAFTGEMAGGVPDEADAIRPSIKATIRRWHSLIAEDRPNYITGESARDAVWKTVTLDCKVIDHHQGLTLKNNPCNSSRRLGRQDDLVPPRTPEAEEALLDALDHRVSIFEGRQVSRRFFTTEKSYMGLGPSALQCGDIVSVLFGGEVPYVLRPVKN